jgi:dihydroorotate dehydrogenase (NAD+) catalytic subunit
VWAKLSPNTNILGDVAESVLDAGADALTLTNTLLGIALDPETHKPALGNGGGGVSGPALHPIALRAVYDLRNRFANAPIVGVGGVLTGLDAQEFLMAGADAVQVGTASFVDPRAVWRIADELALLRQEDTTISN